MPKLNSIFRPAVLVSIFPLALLCSFACRPAADVSKAEAEIVEPFDHAPSLARPEAGEGALLLFLGDSLTAGLGLAEAEAFPARLGELLSQEGLRVRIVNAGVSGDTSAGGLSRIDWLLRQEPDILVLALGANDGLRGLDPSATKENLRRIVRAVGAAGAEVLLCGMQVPPNYGPAFAESFASLFPALATEEGVGLVPFLLAGVGGVAELNQADGIHPTAEGQSRIAAHLLPFLRPLLATSEARGEP